MFIRNKLQTYIYICIYCFNLYVYIYIHVSIYKYKQNVAAIHKIILHRACKSSNVHEKCFATSWSILVTNNYKCIYIYIPCVSHSKNDVNH